MKKIAALVLLIVLWGGVFVAVNQCARARPPLSRPVLSITVESLVVEPVDTVVEPGARVGPMCTFALLSNGQWAMAVGQDTMMVCQDRFERYKYRVPS